MRSSPLVALGDGSEVNRRVRGEERLNKGFLFSVKFHIFPVDACWPPLLCQPPRDHVALSAGKNPERTARFESSGSRHHGKPHCNASFRNHRRLLGGDGKSRLVARCGGLSLYSSLPSIVLAETVFRTPGTWPHSGQGFASSCESKSVMLTNVFSQKTRNG